MSQNGASRKERSGAGERDRLGKGRPTERLVDKAASPRDDQPNKRRWDDDDDERVARRRENSPPSNRWGRQGTRSSVIDNPHGLPPPPPLPDHMKPTRVGASSSPPPPRGRSTVLALPVPTEAKPKAEARSRSKASAPRAAATPSASSSSGVPLGNKEAEHSGDDMEETGGLPTPPMDDFVVLDDEADVGNLDAIFEELEANQQVASGGQADVTSAPSAPSSEVELQSGEAGVTLPPPALPVGDEHLADVMLSPSVQPDEAERRSFSSGAGLNEAPVDSNYDLKYLSPLARQIKTKLTTHVQSLVKESPTFPAVLLPLPCNILLPEGTLAERLLVRVVRDGLAEIQELLRAEPLDPDRVMEAIEAHTSMWIYKGAIPEPLKRLVSLLEKLVARMRGEAAPNTAGDPTATLAEEQARDLQQRLRTIIPLVKEDLKQLEPEAPDLHAEARLMKQIAREKDASQEV
ncbi:uncharacterized protein [Lolium perenne]|uniref:uncharacterized protein n=1 Tax=Lolium perenne TaxID=4522 RepID=UPI0021F5333C|nr:uncharacterized protein LOC127314603 [Lolium perenne]